MEINARVFAVAESAELLEKEREILKEKIPRGALVTERLEPDAALRLSKTWYGFAVNTGMTGEPDTWKSCLYACSVALGTKGAVLVRFRSPDHPDDYELYACTSANGDVYIGKRYYFSGYEKAHGGDDVGRAIAEMVAGSTESQRRAAGIRAEKALAEREEKGEFIIENGVLVKYKGASVRLTIPDDVTEIADYAFVDEESLKKHLGDGAEYAAPPLQGVTIPKSIKKIGAYAFAYCAGLKSVKILGGVRAISGYAFAFCAGLKSITLPNTVRGIGAHAFEGCVSLKEFELPRYLAKINEYTFSGCRKLMTVSGVSIADNLSLIGAHAFEGCTSLKGFQIPYEVKEIHEKAFFGCTGLESIGISGKIKSLSDSVFENCTALKQAYIPKNLEEIGKGTFRNCINLEKVVFTSGLRHIGREAFMGCAKLKIDTIPQGLKEIGENAFEGCHELPEIPDAEELKIAADITLITKTKLRALDTFAELNRDIGVTEADVCSYGDGIWGMKSHLENTNLPEGYPYTNPAAAGKTDWKKLLVKYSSDILRSNGVLVIRFSSTDHPGDYDVLGATLYGASGGRAFFTDRHWIETGFSFRQPDSIWEHRKYGEQFRAAWESEAEAVSHIDITGEKQFKAERSAARKEDAAAKEATKS